MSNYDMLQAVADEEGYKDIDSMLHSVIFDSIVSAVCINCGNITETEPDQNEGWCEDCCTNTVKSILVLAGIA